MTEINKQFGFYGTIKNQFNQEDTKKVWDLMVKKLTEIYPEKPQEEIIDMLNARTGRQLADEIIDEHIGKVMMQIALLNKLKMAKWWAYHYDIGPVPAPVNKKMLYKTAIKGQMKKAWVKDLMKDVLGCNHDRVWYDPELWVNADSTTTQELETMWAYIQVELTKRQ